MDNIDGKKYVYDIQSLYPYTLNNYNEYEEKSLYHEHLLQIRKYMETKDIDKKLQAFKLFKKIIGKTNKIPKNHIDLTDYECGDCFDNRNYYKNNFGESKKFNNHKINPNLFIIYKLLSSIISKKKNSFKNKKKSNTEYYQKTESVYKCDSTQLTDTYDLKKFLDQ